jgi:hypothetical protein
MTTELTLRREYLGAHRRLILGRAILGTVAGVLPVPLVDDWLVGVVLGGAYKRIAATHSVDLDDDAVTSLVYGKTPPPAWAETTASAIAFKVANRTWKRFLLVVTALRRAQAASRQFAALTLFDHYCQRRHTGLGLDKARALEVRGLISEVIAATPGGLSLEPFRRGALAAARAAIRAPLELADIASRGAVRRLLTRGTGDVAEAEVVDEVDQAIDKQLADQDGFLSRTLTAVELQLSADVNPYVDALIEEFDKRWAKLHGGTP